MSTWKRHTNRLDVLLHFKLDIYVIDWDVWKITFLQQLLRRILPLLCNLTFTWFYLIFEKLHSVTNWNLEADSCFFSQLKCGKRVSFHEKKKSYISFTSLTFYVTCAIKQLLPDYYDCLKRNYVIFLATHPPYPQITSSFHIWPWQLVQTSSVMPTLSLFNSIFNTLFERSLMFNQDQRVLSTIV